MNIGFFPRLWLSGCAICLFVFANLCFIPVDNIRMTPSGSLFALPRVLIAEKYAKPVGCISAGLAVSIAVFLYATRSRRHKK